MGLLLFLVVSFAILAIAYRVVGNALARMFALDTSETSTPAHTLRDGLDYEPLRMSALLPQHFSAIAAAGPIVGPILAGMYFGWGPTWLWIIGGSILVGGVHDFTALVASVRHRGRSVAEIIRAYMNPRAYVLFLVFVWFALIYVIIAFADVTAETFVQTAGTAGGEAPGPAVATSSILYLLLAVAMGLALRAGLGPGKAKAIFLPLVGVAILVGPMIPLDLGGLVASPQQTWGFLLLAYCFIAALAPMWILLQPRGELGGYFLYVVMIAGVLGIAIGGLTGNLTIAQPFFLGAAPPAAPGAMFPLLFITVACGACSGFHSIVASGTTSKQLRRECDAKPIAYGGMLLEGFFACISLATVMVLASPAGAPNAIYAQGIARFSEQVLAPLAPASLPLYDILYAFALLCFATFVFDTLDACTRLARYVLMELMGWASRAQAIAATAITLALPAAIVALPRVTAEGLPAVPLWKSFWGIFGSSNQLLAALTLLGITVWMARKRMAWWIAFVPTVFMMTMTLWSLVLNIGPYLALYDSTAPIPTLRHVQFGVTLSLIALSAWLIVEALVTWRSMLAPPAPPLPATEMAPG